MVVEVVEYSEREVDETIWSFYPIVRVHIQEDGGLQEVIALICVDGQIFLIKFLIFKLRYTSEKNIDRTIYYN